MTDDEKQWRETVEHFRRANAAFFQEREAEERLARRLWIVLCVMSSVSVLAVLGAAMRMVAG